MATLIDVAAKELHFLIELKASEIKKIERALCLCEGGPGVSDDEKQAWSYFVGEFYPFIKKMNESLEDKKDTN